MSNRFELPSFGGAPSITDLERIKSYLTTLVEQMNYSEDEREKNIDDMARKIDLALARIDEVELQANTRIAELEKKINTMIDSRRAEI